MSDSPLTPFAREPSWLRQHFAHICEARGVPTYFDRFEPEVIEVDGLRLYASILRVDDDRPTVVFMPGTNAYALLYGEFLTALADKGFNILGFDPRGHGQSDGPRGSYVMAELIRDMQAAVTKARDLFGGPIFVSGSSQGGIAAFYVAASDPTLAGAVCHNMADLGDPESVRLIRYPTLGRIFKPMLQVFASLFPEMKVPMSGYLDLKKEPVRNMGNAWQVLHQDPLLTPYVRLKTLASLGTESLPVPLEEIQTPVMLLQAGDDTIFPTDLMESLFAKLTCPKLLKVYPGLPHYMIVDYVEHFLDDVVGWLEAQVALQS